MAYPLPSKNKFLIHTLTITQNACTILKPVKLKQRQSLWYGLDLFCILLHVQFTVLLYIGDHAEMCVSGHGFFYRILLGKPPNDHLGY